MRRSTLTRWFVNLGALAALSLSSALAQTQVPPAVPTLVPPPKPSVRLLAAPDHDARLQDHRLKVLRNDQVLLGYMVQQAPDNELGMVLTPVDDTTRTQLGLHAGQGLIVTNVAQDGPASQVGLQDADILLSLGEKFLASADDLTKELKEAGEKPTALKLLRAGKPITVQVKPKYQVTLSMVPAKPREYYIGVPVSPPDETLHVHLPDLPGGQGLVATEVLPNSPAEKAGLKPHDILLEFNGKPLTDTETLIAQVQGAEGKAVPVKILRAGKPVTIAIAPELRKEPPELPQGRPVFSVVTMPWNPNAWAYGVTMAQPPAVFAYTPQGELVRSRIPTYAKASGPSEGSERLEQKLEALTAELKRLESLVAEIKTELAQKKMDEVVDIKAEIKAEQKKVDEKVAGIVAKINAAVSKAQAAGATGPELQEVKDTAKRLTQEYQNELNRNYISSLARMTDIFENIEMETAALATNYVQLKRTLDTKTDLQGEHDAHVKQRAALLKKVDEYQTEINKQAAEIAAQTNKLRQLEEETTKAAGLQKLTIKDLRDQIGKDETVLNKPAGAVTFVDYLRGELRTNVTRAMGARPQMRLAIFDKSAAGIPGEKPKGSIELIQVTDTYSIARIEKTNKATEPIRAGDVLYLAAWSPSEPMHFALVGKIDMNRDGRDDRNDLKRMIVSAGGIIDYDLPPPDSGKETGKVTGLCTWYVVDDREPMTNDRPNISEETPEFKEFQKKRADAIRIARNEGVRPMRLERLLVYLNRSELLTGAKQPEGTPKAAETAPAEDAKKEAAPEKEGGQKDKK